MAMILDAFVGKFAEKLLDLIQEQAVMVLGVKDDLQQLRNRLATVEGVLADAERRRIQEKAIDAWVMQLKDVVYDADDMIDLCRIKGARLLHRDGPSSSLSVSYCLPLFSCLTTLPLRYEIGLKIKRLNGRLDTISKDMLGFNLIHIGQDARVVNTISGVDRRRTSELVDPNVVGEDLKNATNALVDQLLVSEVNQPKCVLFAVCGMGGIGKTTLAQQIINHERVEAKFSLKAWLCVSQVFSETDLLRQTIRKVGGSEGGATDISELLPKLKDAVSGKDVFLVLDDVWEGGERVWTDLLRIPLETGASSCRVLVTTRDVNVAMRMGGPATHIHRVVQLSTSSGWELLRKLVFAGGQHGEIATSLEDVGTKIVEKCDGLPLAIKAVSGILRTRNADRGEWERLLANDAWHFKSGLPEDLRGALYLSYEDLPSHLKQCFLYLSLFPEDYQYKSPDVVRMWVAEGFVKPQGDSLLLEEVGEGYLEELLRRNILQLTSEMTFGILFKMHDLMRSLAQHLSRDESCFYGNAENVNEFKIRRLGCAGKFTTIPEPILLHQKTLRTLLFFGYYSLRFVNDAPVLPKYLRVLRLTDTGIKDLPDSLWNLVHLRLLDLSYTSISMVPQGIASLTNLQTLDLSHCVDLHSLPDGITQLCSLRHLLFDDTELRYLPKGIGRLKQLNILTKFIVGEDIIENKTQDHGCSLEELRSLLQLRNLEIENLGRTKVMTTSAVLTNHHRLKRLELDCTSSDINELQKIDELEKVFEQLSPPPCLEELVVWSYFGRSFPNWMMETSLANNLPSLTKLSLYNCTKCSQLPPLGQLSHLRRLEVYDASSVISIGPEFLGIRSREGNNVPRDMPFAKLEYLSLEDMPNWEEWSLGEEFDQQLSSSGMQLLPCLRELTLKDCPKLREVPNGLRHCRIHTFKIREAHSLERITDLQTLEKLHIEDCPALVCVERLDSLRKLKLFSYSMEHLPEWLSRLIQQRRAASPNDYLQLEMECKTDVLRRCREGCADWPIIQQFSRVDAKNFSGRASFSYTKEPYKFNANF